MPSPTTRYNYNKACTRVGYWYYQHGDSKLVWKYFSDFFENRGVTGVEEVIKLKYINITDINDILDNLQTQMELVDGLNASVLYYLGKNYYKGVSE
jgi:oligoendopeptidase F